tara:strand:- start:1166 stop:1543 length:378 start_codon:yes stop_codon:yes gene_type:complete
MNKKELTNIYKKYNLTEEDIFNDRRGFTIITLSGIHKIQLINKISVEYEVIVCSMDNVVLKGLSFLQDQDGEWIKQTETFGSANIKNCTHNFKTEIAEKRCLSRLIIRTIGFTNTHGEAELKHQP